jgi:5-methylcytosine-specific restriction endonuclease McrA
MHKKVSDRTWLKIARQNALVEQKSRCLYCHDPLRATTATAEHRKARSKGGTNAPENIGASCRPCNQLKGSMGEKAFLKLVKSPPKGSPIALWLPWSRRRVNLAALRACRNIARAAGLHFDDF